MRKIVLVFGLLLIIQLVQSQSGYDGCKGQLNDKPVIEATPQLLKKVTNGEKYIIQNGTDYIYVMTVRGSPYQMGYAEGQLMGPEMKENKDGLLGYMQNEVINSLKQDYNLPDIVVSYLNKIFQPVLNFLLDLNWYIALPYTPSRYMEEFKGISAGSQGLLTAQEIARVNMIPELTKAACTIVGAWNQSTKGNRLLQLRALDWSSDAPVNQFPSIVIYNSTEPGSKIFANIGFAGLIGSITGISKLGISVGEKVWIPRNPDLVPYPEITYIGKPWTFVLRDLVQFANNMSEVIQTLSDTKRTMKIHLGVSSLPDNTFRGFNYAANILQNFNDKNYTDYGPNHPQLDGVFYYDKTIQPSNNACVGNILKANWGNITPATLYREVSGFQATGDTQMVTFDLQSREIWCSFSEFGTNVKAYLRSPIHVKLNDFWGAPTD